MRCGKLSRSELADLEAIEIGFPLSEGVVERFALLTTFDGRIYLAWDFQLRRLVVKEILWEDTILFKEL